MHTQAAFTLLLVAAVLAPAAQSTEHAHDRAADSAPIVVRFPAPLRDHTLANMRAHLRALADIQEHIATHHYDLAAEIAEQRLGMSSLKLHGAHEVAKYMPKGMQDAGSAMHHAASKFALTAQESAIDHDMGKSVAALATLTQACVACHAVYRLR